MIIILITFYISLFSSFLLYILYVLPRYISVTIVSHNTLVTRWVIKPENELQKFAKDLTLFAVSSKR